MSTCVQLQYYPSTLLCYIWWQNIKLINTERGPNIYDRDYIVVQLTKITLLYKIKALAYLTRVVKFCLVGNDDEGSGGGVGQNQWNFWPICETRWVGGAKKDGLNRFEDVRTYRAAFIGPSHPPSPRLILLGSQDKRSVVPRHVCHSFARRCDFQKGCLACGVNEPSCGIFWNQVLIVYGARASLLCISQGIFEKNPPFHSTQYCNMSRWIYDW